MMKIKASVDGQLTSQLRKAIKTFGNDSALSRETGVPQACIQLFRTRQRSLTLKTAERLLIWFGYECNVIMPK